MREVISDTSPLQYLFQIGLLDLLNKLYAKVIVPEAENYSLKLRKGENAADFRQIPPFEYFQSLFPTNILKPGHVGQEPGGAIIASRSKRENSF